MNTTPGQMEILPIVGQIEQRVGPLGQRSVRNRDHGMELTMKRSGFVVDGVVQRHTHLEPTSFHEELAVLEFTQLAEGATFHDRHPESDESSFVYAFFRNQEGLWIAKDAQYGGAAKTDAGVHKWYLGNMSELPEDGIERASNFITSFDTILDDSVILVLNAAAPRS